MDSYSVASELDRGTFGVVHLVRRKRDGRVFVMKRMDLGRASQKRARYYYREVQLMSKLHHPNIVTYVDSFHANDQICIVMEYYKDGNLGTFIDQHRERKESMSEEVILGIFTQILFGVYFLHRKDIIHRDLKPKNIFINDNVVVVGDLGISKALDSMNDFAKTFCGTPNYIAPELFLRQKYSKKVDVWSLGCILCEMVTLRQAFSEQRSIEALQKQILSGQFSRLPRSYSPELRTLVEDLLNVSEKKRPTVEHVLKRPFMKLCLQRYVGGLSNNMTYLQVENARRLGGELGLEAGIENTSLIRTDISSKGGMSVTSHPEALPDLKWGKYKAGSTTSASSHQGEKKVSTEDEPLLAARKYILDETLDGNEDSKKKGRGSVNRVAIWRSMRAALLAAGAAFLVGYNLGFSKVGYPAMEWGSDPVFVCDEWSSSYGSHRCVFSLDSWYSEGGFFTGTFLGVCAAVPLCDWFGRRRIIYVCSLLQIAAWCPFLLYDSSLFLIFRSIIGLTVGVFCVATPCYLAEISPETHRGRFVSLFPLMIVAGLATAIIAEKALKEEAVISIEMNSHNPHDFIHTVQEEVRWRSLSFLACVAGAALLITLGCVPESPRWLKAQGMVWTAVHELQRLGNVIDSVALQRLGQTTPPSPTVSELEAKQGSRDFMGWLCCLCCCPPQWRSSMCALLWLLFASHVTLPTVALLRPPQHLATSHPLFIQNPTLAPAVALSSLAMGIYLSVVLIDVLGRRVLLITSLTAMILTASAMCFFSSPYVTSILPSSMPMALLATISGVLYVLSHGFGMTTVPWVVASELTGQKLRALACAAGAMGFFSAASYTSQLDALLREPSPSSAYAEGTVSTGDLYKAFQDKPIPLVIRANVPSVPLWKVLLIPILISGAMLVAVIRWLPELKGTELDKRPSPTQQIPSLESREAGQIALSVAPPSAGVQPGRRNLNGHGAEPLESPLDAYEVTRVEGEGLLDVPSSHKPMWR
mmetsp:Transcript_22764/g.35769  ORF Transcript_22764/g.35769 Transcript_22764/m.35769 type:complete len:985 (-) Transcript_22764:93-3047(-)